MLVFTVTPINPGSVGPKIVILGRSSAAVKWLNPVSTETTAFARQLCGNLRQREFG